MAIHLMDDHELEDYEAPADLQVLEPTVQAAQMTEYISLALREAAKEAAVLLYAPGADPYFEELVKNADIVFYFDEGPRAEARVVDKANARAQRSQTTLGAFT